jgi:hypothetical protein
MQAPSRRPTGPVLPPRAVQRGLWLAALLGLAACAAPAARGVPVVTGARAAEATAAADAREGASTVDVRFIPREALQRSPELRMVPADPVELSGELHVPAGAGPFPVVVLMHGCAGPTVVDRSWALALNANGYAAFRVDSFIGRGLRPVCGDAFRLTPIQRIPDAYGALAGLAGQPRIDAVGLPKTTLPDVDNPAACVLRAPSILGPLLDPAGLAACLRKGATIGWDPDATAEARRIVLVQLAAVLR